MFPIYIQAEISSFDGPVDVRRGDTPAFWRGSDVEFRIAVFEFGVLRDVQDLASLTVEVRPCNPRTRLPDSAAAPLMTRTVSSFDTQLSGEEWAAFERQHAAVAFTGAESAIPAGSHWLVVTAQTRHTPARSLTLCAGPIEVEEDGYSLAGQAPVIEGSAYSKAESDARFARLRQVAATLFVDPVHGVDATALRGRPDLPFLTLPAAIAAAQAGDRMLVAPGVLAGATVTKALRLDFADGAALASAINIDADGCAISGSPGSGVGVAQPIVADGARNVRIMGTLALDKPAHPNIRFVGGLLLDAPGAQAQRPLALPPSRQASVAGRRYSGGRSEILADPRVNGAFAEGGELVALVCPASGAFGVVFSSCGDSPGANDGYYMATSDGDLRFGVAKNNGGSYAVELARTAQGILPANVWSLLRAKFLPPATVELWVNGTKQAITSELTAAPQAADTLNKVIGTTVSGGSAFNGAIARMLLLNSTLTDAEWLAYVSSGVLPQWAAQVGSMANRLATALASGDNGLLGASATISTQSLVARSGNAFRVESTGGGTSFGAYLGSSVTNLIVGQTYEVRAWFFVPSGQSQTPALLTSTSGPGTLTLLDSGNTNEDLQGTLRTDQWFQLRRRFTVGTAGSSLTLFMHNDTPASGVIYYVDDIELIAFGTVLDPDLGRQPVQSRSANGLVALDSATGVSMLGPEPDAMQLHSRAAMNVDGFFNADQAVIPQGWRVESVDATNEGTAGATLTLRYDSSGGTTFATGTIAAGTAQRLTMSNEFNARSSARKIHIGGISGTGARLHLTINLCRTVA